MDRITEQRGNLSALISPNHSMLNNDKIEEEMRRSRQKFEKIRLLKDRIFQNEIQQEENSKGWLQKYENRLVALEQLHLQKMKQMKMKGKHLDKMLHEAQGKREQMVLDKAKERKELNRKKAEMQKNGSCQKLLAKKKGSLFLTSYENVGCSFQEFQNINKKLEEKLREKQEKEEKEVHSMLKKINDKIEKAENKVCGLKRAQSQHFHLADAKVTLI